MTTREDYEHAARAAALRLCWGTDTQGVECPALLNAKQWTWWKPREDDGDSRRLEVACKMRVDVRPDMTHMIVACAGIGPVIFNEPAGTDPYAATRDVVFRCAVDIGRRMQP